MNRYKYLIGGVVLLVFSINCSTEIEPTNPFDPEAPISSRAKGAISGKVIPEDQSDLKKLVFTVVIKDSQFNAIVSEDGSFKLNDLPQGNYFVKVISSDKSYKEEEIGPFEVKPGQTHYIGNIPLILKKGVIKGYFVVLSPNGNKSPAAFKTVFLGKTSGSLSQNLIATDLQDRCISGTPPQGYLATTDGSGKIFIDNIRIGRYKAELFDLLSGIGISNEFEVEENSETDIGEIVVTTPSALLHIEDPETPGIAIDVTKKDNIRVVFGLQNFSGDALVYTGDSIQGALWQNISNTNYKDLNILGEGLTEISVKFRDIFCRESPVFKTFIYKDTTAPVIKNVSIDETVHYENEEFSKSPNIKIRIEAFDAYHEYKADYFDMKMKLTTESIDTIEWETFNTVKDYYLGEEDGKRVIKVVLKDKAGNISETFIKDIILDRTAPSNTSMTILGKILDRNGLVTESNNLTLYSSVRFMFYSDGRGGKVYLYEKHNEQPFSCENVTEEPIKIIPLVSNQQGSSGETAIELSGDGGEKSFYGCFTDAVNNIRATPIVGKIYWDKSPPSNVLFKINNGSPYSSTPLVKITNISASEDYSANMYIMISNCPDFRTGPECITSKWLDFKSELDWDTGSKEGKNEVFLKVRDMAGNESAVAFSSINIDLTDPEPPSSLSVVGKQESNIIYTNTTMPILLWTPSISKDVDYYEIEVRRDGEIDYQLYKATGQSFMLPSLSEGRYKFRIRSVYMALRVCQFVDGPDFVIDTTVPTTPRFEKIRYSVVDLNDSEPFNIRIAVPSSDMNFKEYRIKGGVYSEFVTAVVDMDKYVKFYLLKDNVNTLQIKAVDKAGNESSVDFVVITEDSQNPLPPANIRVEEGNGRAYIRWDPSNSKDVAGYKLYYGFSDTPPFVGSFASEGTSPINVGNRTEFALSSLNNFNKFYVTVTAYDRTENLFHESVMPSAAMVYPSPVSIEHIGSYNEDGAAKRLLTSEGILISLNNDGLRFYDITEPDKPKLIDRYIDNTQIFSASDIACNRQPCKTKGWIYLGKDGYIDIVKRTNGIITKSHIATGYSHGHIFGYEDYIVATIDKGGGFKIYNVIDEGTIEEMGSYESGKIITSSYLENNYLYYIETTDYSRYFLHIADISDINNIQEISTYKIKGYAKWIRKRDTRLYLAYGVEFMKDEMMILDISDIHNPRIAAKYAGTGMLNIADTKNNYIFLVDSQRGLIVLDQSSLPNLQEISSLGTLKDASDIVVKDNYAYFANGYSGLTVVNLSNINSPQSVFSENLEKFYTRKVVVQGAYAYLANHQYPKVVILDISKPENILKKGELKLPTNPEGLFIHGNHLYIACGAEGLIIADVSDPSSPVIISSLKGKTINNIYYSNGFIFGAGGTSFYSIDVKNINDPVLKKELPILTDPQKLVVRGKAAYVADGSGGVKVINVNNPSNPTFANSYSSGNPIVDVILSGKRIILAEDGGLKIIEVNNIENPTNFNLRGNFKISGTIRAIAMSGSYVYFPSAGSGLWVVDISNPANNLSCPGSIYCKGLLELPNRENADIFIDGTVIYMAQDYLGLEIYEIASPTMPVLSSEINVNNISSHSVQNGFLFLTDPSSLKVYDITNLATPTFKSSYSPINSAKSIALSGNYAYLPESSNNGMQVIDIADPTNLQWVPNYSFNFGNSTNISIFGRNIFLSQSTSVKILEFTSPYDITYIAEIPEPNTQRVIQQGDYLFLPCYQYGLMIYDNTKKTNPQKIANFKSSGNIISADIKGKYAYLAADYEGIIILDITNPQNPVKIGSFWSSVTPAYDVKVYKDIAYIACSYYGLAAINVKDPQNPYLMARYSSPEITEIVSVQGNTAFVQTREGIQIVNLEP